MKFRNSKIEMDFTKSLKYRSILIFSIFTFFFIMFSYKAFKLQVTRDDEKLKVLLNSQLTSKIGLTPQRGEILDSTMRELAISIKMDSLYAHPGQVEDKDKTAQILSDILGEPKSKFVSKLNSKRGFVWIKRLMNPDKVSKTREKDIKGLYFIPESNRFYPNKHLAAQTIGFVGFDSKGLEGLELKYDSNLLGKQQFYKIQKDAMGRPIIAIVNNQSKSNTEMLFTNYISKENIVLTIDKELQYWAEQELVKAITLTDAPRGEIIVFDPNSGKIIAMANYPFFNPNNFSNFPRDSFRNRSVSDMFDPGSTFKLFTVALAFEKNLVTPETKIFCENGMYRIGNRSRIREAQYKKFEDLTVKEIIKHSSNIGTVKIAQKLDSKEFYDFLLGFGFDQKTNIDLPGEAAGRLRQPSLWKEIDKANISFGQGVSVTSIQLVTAFSALVNGGTLYKPYIVDKIVDNARKTIREFKPEIIRDNLISKKTSDGIREIMLSVLEPDGTARNAYIEGASIGGKTGTAQIFDVETSRYSDDKYISSFIGAFPIEDPRYVIFVKIDDPRKNKFASVSAVPTFKEVAKYLLTDLKRENQQMVKENKDLEGKRYVLNHFRPTKDLKIKTIIIDNEEKIKLPDLKKMSLRQALIVLNEFGLDYTISGSGTVLSQNPKPGSLISKNSKIEIKLENWSTY